MKRLFSVAVAVIVIAVSLSGCFLFGNNPPVSSSSNGSSDISSNTSSGNPPTESVLPSTPSTAPVESDTSSGTVSSGEPEKPVFTPISAENKWYYSNLSDVQKEIYLVLKDYIENFKTGYTPLEVEGITSIDDIGNANLAFRNDYPEYFWVPNRMGYIYDGTVYSFAYLGPEENEESVYICSKQEAERMLKEQNEVIEVFINTLKKGMTDYDIELALHDWLAECITYSIAAADDYKSYPLAYTAYGALINGSAVCEGYAEAMSLILGRVGIQSITITGDYGGGHMWNMVNIGGDWYHVDVTNDDLAESSQQGMSIKHNLFNRTDEYMESHGYTIDPDFSEDIMESESYNLFRPKATAKLKSYYNVSGYVVKANLPSDNFISLIVSAKEKGEKVFEFYIDESLTEFDFNTFVLSAKPKLVAEGVLTDWYAWNSNDKFLIIK